MYDIIVAFPKIEDAKSVKNVLVQNGIPVSRTANSGAQVILLANELDGGIVICGYRFRDMYYRELKGDLPEGFSTLLIATAARLEEAADGEVCLKMPFQPFELVDTVTMMARNFRRKRKKEKATPGARSEEDKKVIGRAKYLLMERNHMSEQEAHRYIQKTSMDNGTNMAETARMLLALM